MSSLESHRLSVGGGPIGSKWPYPNRHHESQEDSDEKVLPSVGASITSCGASSRLRGRVLRRDGPSGPSRAQRWSLLPMMHTILAGILAGEDPDSWRPRVWICRCRDFLPCTGGCPTPRSMSSWGGWLLTSCSAPWWRRCGRCGEQVARSFGLPCGVIAIDGKSLGALDHDADGWGSGTRATTTARRIGLCGRCERC